MRRFAGPAVGVPLVAAWSVPLRPAPLGGPAAYVIVTGNSMQPALTPGALVIGRRQTSYARGDVIVYRVPKGDPGAGTRVIHRVVGGSAEAGYITRGDNRQGRDRWRPKPDEIDGAKVVAVPGAGRVMMLLASPLVLGGLVAILVFASVDDVLLPRRRRPTPSAAFVPVAGRPVTPATVLSVPWLWEPEPVAPAVQLDPPVVVMPVAVEPPVIEPPVAPVHAVRRRRRVPAQRRRVLATSGAVAGCIGAGVLLSRAGRAR